MGEPFTFGDVADLTGRRFGCFDVPCPACGPERKAPINRERRVLRVWINKPDVLSYRCARCGVAGLLRSDGSIGPCDARPPLATNAEPSDEERTTAALKLWRETVSPVGTVVETYLSRRGLTLPPGAAGSAIAYHPWCPFGRGMRVRAMVALVRDITTDKPLGIHRTALTDRGEKTEVNGQSRMSLGPIGGGAVKLTPDSEVTLGLGVGEGIESTLSLRLLPACSELAVWPLLSANAVERFPMLPGVEGLWVAVDHDPTGIAAAAALGARYQAAARDVVTVKPKADGCDLNDLARARHG